MSEQAPSIAVDSQDAPPKRQRMKPGERRLQILQTLALMLEQPGADRITTAALAAQLGVSEAALYRHFASKTQMFEGLIDFIDNSLSGLIQQVVQRDAQASHKAMQVLQVVLHFAEKNPGMTRVMVGDALVFEDERLQQRINHIFDRLESVLRQVLREDAPASMTPTVDAQIQAAALVSFVLGSMQRYVRSGFKRSPVVHLEKAVTLFV